MLPDILRLLKYLHSSLETYGNYRERGRYTEIAVWDKTWRTPWRTCGVFCGLPVAYLLFCKDTFITLAFEGIRTSYLVHIGLLAMAIYGITHCYGNFVTMATGACVCNFAV